MSVIVRMQDYAPRERPAEKVSDLLWERQRCSRRGEEYSCQVLLLPVFGVRRLEPPADCAQ